MQMATSEQIVTDERKRGAQPPVPSSMNSLYDGETYDARSNIQGGPCPGS